MRTLIAQAVQTCPNQPKFQILFHKKRPLHDMNKKTLDKMNGMQTAKWNSRKKFSSFASVIPIICCCMMVGSQMVLNCQTGPSKPKLQILFYIASPPRTWVEGPWKRWMECKVKDSKEVFLICIRDSHKMLSYDARISNGLCLNCQTGPSKPKLQILFHIASPPQDLIRRTLDKMNGMQSETVERNFPHLHHNRLRAKRKGMWV